MPESSDSRSAVGVVLVVAWVSFALLYPGCWTPSAIMVQPLEKGYRTIPLKLPDTGPLRLMLDRGSRVTLRLPAAVAQADTKLDPKAQVIAAPPTSVLPASTDTVEHVYVQSTVCLGSDRRSDCYAVLSLAEEHVERVMKAPQVWIILEQQ